LYSILKERDSRRIFYFMRYTHVYHYTLHIMC
jgi:hypothetical protein